MIIRPATLNDLPQLLEIEQGVIAYERPFNPALKPEGATYYDLPFLIADDNSQLLVVEDDAVIIGTGYVQIRTSQPSRKHAQHGYLGFMFVASDYRGQGINQQVLARLKDWAFQRDVTDFYLNVYSQNASAIRAYEKAGFTSLMTEMKL